jgi:hypothetical protein
MAYAVHKASLHRIEETKTPSLYRIKSNVD